MFDVNGLKLVNDSFGHDLGDALLKKSAEAIKKACREEDIIARIGGDEFVILLPRLQRLKQRRSQIILKSWHLMKRRQIWSCPFLWV